MSNISNCNLIDNGFNAPCDYPLYGNVYAFVMNEEEVLNKRVRIYKKGVGEVGSLSIDEVSIYLKNELNLYKIVKNICVRNLVCTYMEFCIENNIKMENAASNELLKVIAISKVIEECGINKESIKSSNVIEECSENWRVEISCYTKI